MFYIIQNVTNPNATSFTFNLTGWATLRFRMRAVNRFGPSRASVTTTKVCQTDVGSEYIFGCQFYFTNAETINDIFLGQRSCHYATLIPILLNEKIATSMRRLSVV